MARTLRALLLAGGLLTLAGCGAAITGALAGGISASGGGSSSGGANGPASISTGSPDGDTDSGSVDIVFVIQDPEGDAVPARFFYSTDPNALSTQTFADEATGNLEDGAGGAIDAAAVPTSAGGISYRFVWNTAQDLGATLNQGTVRIQIVLGEEPVFTTNFFSVDNTTPPSLGALLPDLPSGASVYADAQFLAQVNEAAIPVALTLSDPDGQDVSVEVFFSTDGGQSFPAQNVASGVFLDAGGAQVTPPLPTNASGVPYTFLWRSELNGLEDQDSVVLRFSPADSKGGTAMTTPAFALNNGDFSALIATPSGVGVGRVRLDYLLFDEGGDPLDVALEFSVGSGGFRSCTRVIQPPSEGLAGLSADAAGGEHIFLWNAFFDLESLGLPASNMVRVRARPTRPTTQVTGSSSTTNPFVVDNRLLRTTFAEGEQLVVTQAVDTEIPPPVEVAANANVFVFSTGFGGLVGRVDRMSGSLVAAAGGGVDDGDGIPATEAQLGEPFGIEIDGPGQIYFGDRDRGALDRVDATNGLLNTLVANARNVRGPVLERGLLHYAIEPPSANAGSVLYSVPPGGGTPTELAGGGTLNIADPAVHYPIDPALMPAMRARLNIQSLAAGPTPGTLIYSDPQLGQVVGVNLDPMNAATIAGISVNPLSARRVAGTGSGGAGAVNLEPDGQMPRPATGVNLNDLHGLASDPTGAILVCERAGNRVWRIDAANLATVVVGRLQAGLAGDGGPASQARLSEPRDVAIDPSGGFFIADTDNRRVRRVDATGIITTVAGTTPSVGDGFPAPQGALDAPAGLVANSAGVAIADFGQDRLRVVDAATGNIATAAGTGAFGLSGDNGQATSAELGDPVGVALDAAGNLYVSQEALAVVRRIDSAGVITRVLGTGVAGTGMGGPAPLTMVGELGGLDVEGNVLVVADQTNAWVWAVNLSTTGTETMLGTMVAPGEARRVVGGLGGSTTALQTFLNFPVSVAFLGGDLLVVETDAHNVLRISGDGQTVTELLPNAMGMAGFADGSLAAAFLTNPTAIVADESVSGESVVYLADVGNERIRMLNLGAGAITRHGQTLARDSITTVAGTGVEGFSGDGGPATQAQIFLLDDNLFKGGRGGHLAIDEGTRSLLFSDSANDRVRRVDDGGQISTVAGGGALDGDGGGAAVAELSTPLAIDVGDDDLTLSVFDAGRVRTVDPATTQVRSTFGSGVNGAPGDPALVVPATTVTFAFNDELALEDLGTEVFAGTAPVQLSASTTALEDPGQNFVGEGIRVGMRLIRYGSSMTQGRFVADMAYITRVEPTRLEFTELVAAVVVGMDYEVHPDEGPRGLATATVGGADLQLVADTLNHALVLANVDEGDTFSIPMMGPLGARQARTIGGNAQASRGLLDGDLGMSEYAFPQGVAMVGSGLVVVADTGNHAIRALNLSGTPQMVGMMGVPSGQVVTLLDAGDGVHFPVDVALDADGNLLWAEQRTASLAPLARRTRVRMLVNVPGSYYGQSAVPGDVLTVIRHTFAQPLQVPGGIDVDGNGALYVTNLELHTVLQVDRLSGDVTRVAAAVNAEDFPTDPILPLPGNSGDGGPATNAMFNGTRGIAVNSLGTFWVIDSANERIRRAKRFP